MNQKNINHLASAREKLERMKGRLYAHERKFRESLRQRIIRGNYDLLILAKRTKIKRNRLHNYISNNQALTIKEIQLVYNEFKFPVTPAELATRTRKPCWKKKLPAPTMKEG